MALDELRDWFDRRVADHLFSGTALVWRNGQALFSYAGGLALRGHGLAVTDSTRFATASVTKMVTASAILQLVDRGLLRLDQPIIEVLPAEQRPTALTAEHTVHHLLAHTSGLANYHDDDDPTWASFTSIFDRIPSYHLRRPADMLPLFIDLPAVSPAGSRFAYCDATYVLLGLVIEALTGRPYADAVTDAVLRPAGMTESSFEALEVDPPGLATGYLTSSEVPFAEWQSNVFKVTAAGMPDGGMISTGRDLVRLVGALLDGRLVSAASLAAMSTPQGPLSDESYQFGYGLGLSVVDGRVTTIGHGGSDPGVSTLVSHHLASATTFVVLCNFDRGSLAATQQLERAFGVLDGHL